jgi:hypothetical protein
MTIHHPLPAWQPIPNLAALAEAALDAAAELASRLRSLPDTEAPSAHANDGDERAPTLGLAVAWETAAMLAPIPGQLAKAFEQLATTVAAAARGDRRLTGLAETLAEGEAAMTDAAERLDAADELLGMLQDPDVADQIDQLASHPEADGVDGEASDTADDGDLDDVYCPVTTGFHRPDWPTVRLPRGEHSVLVNCAACGQVGEVNGIDRDQIDWPADLADLAG